MKMWTYRDGDEHVNQAVDGLHKDDDGRQEEEDSQYDARAAG